MELYLNPQEKKYPQTFSSLLHWSLPTTAHILHCIHSSFSTVSTLFHKCQQIMWPPLLAQAKVSYTIFFDPPMLTSPLAGPRCTCPVVGVRIRTPLYEGGSLLVPFLEYSRYCHPRPSSTSRTRIIHPHRLRHRHPNPCPVHAIRCRWQAQLWLEFAPYSPLLFIILIN